LIYGLKHNFNGITIVLVYIDDLVIIDDNQGKINCVKDLKQKFNIKDLDKLKYIFEIEIAHSLKGLFISQKKICV
jgi:hypothetical protein